MNMNGLRFVLTSRAQYHHFALNSAHLAEINGLIALLGDVLCGVMCCLLRWCLYCCLCCCFWLIRPLAEFCRSKRASNCVFKGPAGYDSSVTTEFIALGGDFGAGATIKRALSAAKIKDLINFKTCYC